MENMISRFTKYVKFNTKSDDASTTCPTTPGQLVLGNALVEELKALGVSNASIDSNGYIMATIPSNVDANIPKIGFIAHMDTSPDMSGENVNPKFVENYDGGDIVLNEEQNIVMSIADFPEIAQYAGETLITTDGTTLLGADDKAGICEIMTAVEYIMTHPEFKHGEIKIGFTPDEEVGRGADFFDVEKFGADYAYTMDGGEIGELEYESFNAAEARVKIKGRNVHPGYAKNKMVNSITLSMELNSMLSPEEVPEHTANYEGFFHIHHIEGDVEGTNMIYIVRDHDMNKFQAKKEKLSKIVTFLNDKYGEGTFELALKDQYYNMGEKIKPVYHVVENAEKAMLELGIEPKIKPIRGGTDGSRLSYMGLPCPNIFTGGHNFHGRYECISVHTMDKAVKVILKIIENYAKN